VKAVVDYAVTRDDVEVSRLALIGYSLGGLLAPRAAAFEPRIRACIANPPTIDVGERHSSGLAGGAPTGERPTLRGTFRRYCQI
jgi:dienelactone hydrolase